MCSRCGVLKVILAKEIFERGLPVGWQELIELPVRPSVDVGDDARKVLSTIDACRVGGGDNRKDIGESLGASPGASKEPGLSSGSKPKLILPMPNLALVLRIHGIRCLARKLMSLMKRRAEQNECTSVSYRTILAQLYPLGCPIRGHVVI